MLNDCDSGNETNQETVEVDNERKSYIVVHKQDASKRNRSLGGSKGVPLPCGDFPAEIIESIFQHKWVHKYSTASYKGRHIVEVKLSTFNL